MDFINRQLVETRQSTKVVAQLLKEMYPNAEIVYVKAGLVSEFRQTYELVKCRAVNDLHHAKDAYLNIVVGNVYHERFNRQWFRLPERYSVKLEKDHGKALAPRSGSDLAGRTGHWEGEEDRGQKRGSCDKVCVLQKRRTV